MNTVNLCRVCGESKSTLEWIFRKENREILAKIKYVACSKIHLNDCLPQHICVDCSMMLDLFYEFKFMYEESFKRYKKLNLKRSPHHTGSSDLISGVTTIERDGETNKSGREGVFTILHLNPSRENQDDAKIFISNYLSKRMPEFEKLQAGDEKIASDEDKSNHESYSIKTRARVNVSSDKNQKDIIEGDREEVPNNSQCSLVEDKQESIGKSPIRDDRSECLNLANKYQCKQCSKSYSNRHKLKVHQSLHLNPDLFKCKQCGKSYSSARSLKRHQFSHSKSSKHECQQCSKSYSNRNKLKVRQSLKSYSNDRSLKRHQVSHSKSSKYNCKQCSKSYSNRHKLQVHQSLHLNPDLFKCEQCGKSYSNDRSLKRHEFSHSSSCKYECNICSKSFTRPSNLEIHKALHVNPDIYKCNICNKSFTMPCHLKTHKVIHSNPDRYKCEICNKLLADRRNLKNHLALHRNPDMFNCDLCNKSFKQPKNLEFHKRKHSK